MLQICSAVDHTLTLVIQPMAMNQDPVVLNLNWSHWLPRMQLHYQRKHVILSRCSTRNSQTKHNNNNSTNDTNTSARQRTSVTIMEILPPPPPQLLFRKSICRCIDELVYTLPAVDFSNSSWCHFTLALSLVISTLKRSVFAIILW